jgi:ribonuclease G
MPQYADAVQLYQGDEPIFDAFGIELEVERALGKKVWLKSGGYLVIEQTEALTAVDINTGKFVGKHTLEDTILQINLEAVREVAYQLRLRNIGGLIIIDFIDMEKPAHREKVFHALEDALQRDKAKTHVTQISEFGLIEMTRKRVRESLTQTLCEPCAYCEGRGYLKSHRTVAYEVLRHLQRELIASPAHSLEVIAHRDVVHMLYDEEADALAALEQRWGKRIEVKASPNCHIEQYEVIERTKPPPRAADDA